MKFSLLFSRAFLTQKWVLWTLLFANLVGTLYGYYWYKGQLEFTWNYHPAWQFIFVPDSPTASLFFTVSLLFLIVKKQPVSTFVRIFRKCIEALAVVTSIKYGVWACVMIVASVAQGKAIVWQDWMLISSHLAMAVEALLFVRMFTFGKGALLVALSWTWLNDVVDYTYGVFPALHISLMDDLQIIFLFTLSLTALSGIVSWCAYRYCSRYATRVDNFRIPM
ncbi:DUF1405 domain-containing protein [Paenibacillus sp. 481]|uniref:DUF1405 domain-containing protein n=1 Tax=Paenibacillus sp. 481 TaxID=2835869 RepID=UPI001E650DA5|nr:DUF1405 domain-containing protein [Paenibacillus sp. 481]UHA72985.1 DUF1405 domain-containing protein [Paenibacillus sp. 481]